MGTRTTDCKAYVEVLQAGHISLHDLQSCIKIIKTGGAVDMRSANRELTRANVVVVVRSDAEIVGVGAIKGVRCDYASKIVCRSGVSFARNMHELGYVAVHPDHQGHGHSREIVNNLLSIHHGPLFATTSNERMKKTLTKARFEHKGNTWKSKRDGKEISLWMRQ